MKNYLFFLVFICASINLHAQSNKKSNSKTYVSRIDFNEKQNSNLKSIPAQLIEAYSDYKIKGYAPSDPKVQVNFIEFLINAGISLPPQLSEGVRSCHGGISIDPFLIEVLSGYMDVYEEEFFDIQTSMLTRKVTHVTLVFGSKYDYRGIDTPAITFFVSDMNSLPRNHYNVKSMQNDAVVNALQDVFILKLFSGTVIQKQNQILDKPAESQQKDIRKQSENYENKNE